MTWDFNGLCDLSREAQLGCGRPREVITTPSYCIFIYPADFDEMPTVFNSTLTRCWGGGKYEKHTFPDLRELKILRGATELLIV